MHGSYAVTRPGKGTKPNDVLAEKIHTKFR